MANPKNNPVNEPDENMDDSPTPPVKPSLYAFRKRARIEV